MSRYVKDLGNQKEAIYGCDDYGYFYLLFDDYNGIPEEDYLILKEGNVETEKFLEFLLNIKANPTHIKHVKQNKLF